MDYAAWLVVHGALAGAIYALVALAFVVVYKASRAVNFAVGEWVLFGALLTASGLHRLELGLAGALAFAVLGIAGLAWVFANLVLNRVATRSLMFPIMLTLGLGMLMRGVGHFLFKGTVNAIPPPFETGFIEIGGLVLPPERVVCATIALACVAVVAWFYRFTRAGLALRAVASNAGAARGMGINVGGMVTLAWIIAGAISVAAGVLWSMVSGGGFGTALVGLKVFPIVVIGGLNSITGCIVGAMLIGVAESLASGYLDELAGSGVSVVVSSSLLLLALWLRPQGLFGERVVARV